MQRISTSATLILKFFIPTFWAVFFGLFWVGTFVIKLDYMGRISARTIQIITTILFLSVLFLFWRTLMNLKRMEIDDDYLYVTNYFKTYRYSFNSIEKVSQSDYMFFKTLSVHLKEAGSFGKKVTCIQSQKLFADFLRNHPKVALSLKLKPDFEN